ncbi:MAG: LysM peptidoglycan-binding domain-containing protein [Planctomycetes bacterium]|nr:LysM peptidoglycan-binding domain-containing protein [Planctomycetota bacterium]
MRKLLLFGLLAGVFGLAFGLEQLFTTPRPQEAPAGNKARFVIGGGAPRSVPEESLEILDDEPVRTDSPREDATAKAKEKTREPPKKEPPAPEAIRFHEVTARETLWTIAEKELGAGTRYRELAAWNGLDAEAPLRVGAKLRLGPGTAVTTEPTTKPAPAGDPAGERTHKLVKGETLSRIAARYLGDAGRWREIQSLNKIADPANVPEGSVLKLPAR